MTPADDRRVLTVLCADGGDRPPLLAPVQERVDVRWTDPAGLGEAVAGADALLLWDFFSTAVSGVWHRADRLEWIHVAAAGVDKLLFPGLVDSDVTVTNARGVFDRPIAEYVLGMCLAHAKRLPAMLSDQGAGRTARPGDPDFGDVLASADLPSYVGDFDHVVLVTPLTEQTRGLVGPEVLAAMRPTAHLVNVGRGAVVDEPALVQALREGGIAHHARLRRLSTILQS